MMVSTCSNELKFMSERERSTKPALNGYTNPDFRELRPVDQPDGVPLSRTRVRGEWGGLGGLYKPVGARGVVLTHLHPTPP